MSYDMQCNVYDEVDKLKEQIEELLITYHYPDNNILFKNLIKLSVQIDNFYGTYDLDALDDFKDKFALLSARIHKRFMNQ